MATSNILQTGVPGKTVVDSKDNIYLASPACIFKLKIDNNDKGQFEVYAGSYDYSGNEDGTLKTATFNNISHFAMDKNDNLYVIEKAWPLMNKIGKENNKWFNEPGVPAKLNQGDYWYYTYDSKGNLFIADEKNSCVRKLSADGNVSTVTYFDHSKANINK